MKDKFLIGIVVLLSILVLIGEIRCVYKAVTCNWDPIGKAEILYTVGAVTGAGAVIGYIDIEDK